MIVWLLIIAVFGIWMLVGILIARVAGPLLKRRRSDYPLVDPEDEDKDGADDR